MALELHDYERLRLVPTATVLIPSVSEPTVVLGSGQSTTLLGPEPTVRVRTRRGGGGAVLLRDGDLWLDFWIPSGDRRHRDDVATAAVLVGEWWAGALRNAHGGQFSVSRRTEPAPPELRVACFATIGVGEVTLAGQKVVGVTQWRVREGALVATVLHRSESSALASYLVDPPPDLAATLAHASLESLSLTGAAEDLVTGVLAVAGPWSRTARSL